MGLLDNLVGQLVGNATGINSRQASRWVRRIGTGNIMKIGGAAVAGAVMTHMMHDQQKKTAPASAALPPLPSTQPPADLPPLPDLPSAGDKEPDLPEDLVFAVGRTLIAAALADGEMAADERTIVEGHLESSQLSAQHKARLQQDLVLPPTATELADQVKGQMEDAAEVLYRFGALVALADKDVSQMERRWLDSLGQALGLRTPRCQALEEELRREVRTQENGDQ